MICPAPALRLRPHDEQNRFFRADQLFKRRRIDRIIKRPIPTSVSGSLSFSASERQIALVVFEWNSL
jgi:hypothetical protein